MGAKTILITGASGKAGEAIAGMIKSETSFRVIAQTSNSDYAPFNEVDAIYRFPVNDPKRLKELCLDVKPEIIINTAGISNPVNCENDRKLAREINSLTVENLVKICKVTDSHLIIFSSDQVFDGFKGPYTEGDTPNPVNYLGKTMLAAENACKAGNIKFTIFRINNMFGYSSSNKPDTVAEIVEMLSEKQDCPLPVDVFVNPVYTEDTAIAVLKIIEKKRTGIYNLGSPERLSLFEFARRIADVFNLDSNYIKGKKAAEIYKNVKIATNCGLINLKAETDLGIKFAKIINSLTAYKFRLGLVN